MSDNMVSLNECKEYLTLIKFKTSFLIQAMHKTFWCIGWSLFTSSHKSVIHF